MTHALTARAPIRGAYLAIALAVLAVPAWTMGRAGPTVGGYLGVDYHLYMDAARRWLATGTFYLPHQLEPYAIAPGDILYPPVVLWLLVPFTVLPAVLWWAVPLGLVGYVLWRLRPAPWTWPFVALLLVPTPSTIKLVTGNPVMWVMAALAAGVLWVGPAVFVLIKPTLAPFALWGARHRRWWAWLAAFGLLCLPFGGMWTDWLRVVGNSQPSDLGGGLLYSVWELPLLLVPLVAWAGRAKMDAERMPAA